MIPRRCLVLFVAALLVGNRLFAEMRIEVKANVAGVDAPAAEICFYPAIAGNALYPLDAPDVRCLATDTILSVPPQTFGYFVRAGDKYIVRNHGFITATGTEGKDAFRRIRADLSPAAHLSLSRPLKADERILLILGESGESHGMTAVWPVDGLRLLVPSSIDFVPVLVRKGKPVWAGATQRLRPGVDDRLELEAQGTGETVIASFTGDDPFAEQKDEANCRRPFSARFIEMLPRLGLPEAVLIDSKGRTHKSPLPIVYPENVFDNLLVFSEVAPGPATIRVSGPNYVTREARITVQRTGLTIVPRSARISPAARVGVTIERLGSAVMPTARECGGEAPANSREQMLHLWTCARSLDTVQLSPMLLRQCQQQGERVISIDGGTAAFEGLEPGQYLLSLSRADRVTRMRVLNAAPGADIAVAMGGDEFYLTGVVKRDDRPVHAQLRFTTGAATTDPATGEYAALLNESPGSNPIHVIDCDDSWVYVHRPKTVPLSGTPFDITIPNNVLRLTLRDGGTRRILRDVKVVAMARGEDDERSDGAQVSVVAREEAFEIDSLDTSDVVNVCGSATGYKSSCKEFAITKGVTTGELVLEPEALRGKVDAPGYANIAFISSEGRIVLEAGIDGEGEFAYDRPWTDGYAVLTGTAPLFVTAVREVRDGTLVLRPPRILTRKTLQVVLGEHYPRPNAIVGVWLNGFFVPVSVFAKHQIARGRRWFASKDRPLIIADVNASDVVSVAAGPDVDFIPQGGIDNPMMFAGMTPLLFEGTTLTLQ